MSILVPHMTNEFQQIYLCGRLGLVGLEPADPFDCCFCGLVGAECMLPVAKLWLPGERSLRALALTGVDGGKGDLGDTGGWEGIAGDKLIPSAVRASRWGSRR